MSLEEQFSQQDIDVRRIEHEETVEFVADVGRADGTVEVVGDTAIVVSGGTQYDLALPEAGNAQAFMKNGVLTIEVRA